MKIPRSPFDVSGVTPLLHVSRVRLGKHVAARGVPAILWGVAAIVLARGLTATLLKATAIVPESLREARSFWLAIRDERRARLS